MSSFSMTPVLTPGKAPAGFPGLPFPLRETTHDVH